MEVCIKVGIDPNIILGLGLYCVMIMVSKPCFVLSDTGGSVVYLWCIRVPLYDLCGAIHLRSCVALFTFTCF